MCTVEPSLVDTNGTYRIVQYSEVSLPQGLLIENELVAINIRTMEILYIIDAPNSGVC